MTGNGSLEKRLAVYRSMSLALAAVSMPAAAQAGSIAYTANLTTGNGQGGAIYFNPETGYAGVTAQSSHDFELLTSVQGSNGSLGHAYIEAGPDNAANGNEFAMSGSSVARLNLGASIGPVLKFSSAFGTLADNSSPAFGQWNPAPESGVVGLEMPSGDSYVYGWADITVNSDYTITLTGLGSGDPGETVVADLATPEPASIVLLALGAAGIEAWRRKKSRAR